MSLRYNVFKVVIIGDGAVGKTTTINTLNNYISTQGKMITSNKQVKRTKFINFETIYNICGVSTILQVWDCQGQRLNQNHPLDLIRSTILESSSVIILMFALDDSSSLENILLHDGWLDLIEPVATKNNTPVILLGNKADRPVDVFEEYIMKKMQSIPCIKKYLSISSITGLGIPELSDFIQKCLIEQSKANISEYINLKTPSFTSLSIQSGNTF